MKGRLGSPMPSCVRSIGVPTMPQSNRPNRCNCSVHSAMSGAAHDLADAQKDLRNAATSAIFNANAFCSSACSEAMGPTHTESMSLTRALAGNSSTFGNDSARIALSSSGLCTASIRYAQAQRASARGRSSATSRAISGAMVRMKRSSRKDTIAKAQAMLDNPCALNAPVFLRTWSESDCRSSVCPSERAPNAQAMFESWGAVNLSMRL
mmetsp:Transcript_15034/g.34126  ORF Transcript_15034/g.34126 Transcript_15034/m.34126 type:complete len:209 (-) Transcript_15034:1433-2059(-)